MAPKKVAAKSAGKTKPTSLVRWDEKFAKYATEAKKQVANVGTGSGVSVSFGHGTIGIGGVVDKSGKLECIIVGSCALNRFYKKKYSADDKQPPDCYALAVISDDPDMAPHAQATDKQSEKCADCEKNEFGSADTGRGKACNNTIRLGLILAKDATDAESATAAELATASVSPTNRKYFSEYVDALETDEGRPPWAVVTEIQSHHDDKTQIRLEFRMVSLIDEDDVLNALEKRFLKIQDVLQKPFSAPIDRGTKSGAKKAGGSKRFAAKKGAARK
jgi:hypothetical protein